jgi:type II secretion system protein I
MEQKRQRGMTLISALVAMLIMSTAMTALFRLYSSTRLNNHHVAATATALGLARNKIEQLRFDIGAEADGSDALMFNATHFERQWQSTDNPGMHTRRVVVTLQWSEVSGNYELSLTTTLDTQPLTSWPPDTPH